MPRLVGYAPGIVPGIGHREPVPPRLGLEPAKRCGRLEFLGQRPRTRRRNVDRTPRVVLAEARGCIDLEGDRIRLLDDLSARQSLGNHLRALALGLSGQLKKGQKIGL